MVGTNDPTISDHLKAFIQREGGPVVVGIIGEGSSRELTALWESPFENDTPGSLFSKGGGLVQAGALGGVGEGRTSKTTLNTTQVGRAPRPTISTWCWSFTRWPIPLPKCRQR